MAREQSFYNLLQGGARKVASYSKAVHVASAACCRQRPADWPAAYQPVLKAEEKYAHIIYTLSQAPQQSACRRISRGSQQDSACSRSPHMGLSVLRCVINAVCLQVLQADHLGNQQAETLQSMF